MLKTFNIIPIMITINLAAIFLILNIQNSFEQEDNTGNLTIGESNNLSFKYPSHWEVNISDSRFDNYELLFRDQASNATIYVLDEAINDYLYHYSPESYFESYIMNYLTKVEDAYKIETYPKGKFSIAGLPAYSQLYVGEESRYAFLISLAFQETNERHYTIFSSSPESNYDELEPTMLEIIKSITPKNIKKPLDQDGEIPPNSTDLGNNQEKFTGQLKKECMMNFNEDICNFLFK